MEVRLVMVFDIDTACVLFFEHIVCNIVVSGGHLKKGYGGVCLKLESSVWLDVLGVVVGKVGGGSWGYWDGQGIAVGGNERADIA